jgi:DNA-binding transcriptional MocR family regulator
MNEFLTIKLDKSPSSPPVYKQLANGLLELIENGTLKPESKLPPIRIMASALKLNNITVVNAYKYLENKKVVYSQTGSGTYVSGFIKKELPTPILSLSEFRDEDVKNASLAINFANSATSPELFPVNEFKELFNQVLERDRGDAFNYTDVCGYKPLRMTMCDYLSRFGIKTTYDKIQIVSGAQQGLDIISKAILRTGDTVFVESPTYYGAIGSFLAHGAQIIDVPIQKDGIDIEKLEDLLKIYRPKFIYIMSYYQTPTCYSYSLDKKKKLLEIAYKYDTYIIEEDNQSDFNYTDNDIIPLKALDYRSKVIYIKTFSKILMPGLRLGLMVLPKKIIEVSLSAKYISDITTSGFIQRAFDLYIRSDNFYKHIEFMKTHYQAKYERLTALVDDRLSPYLSFEHPNGGLSLWLELKNKEETSSQKLCKELADVGVILIPSTVFSKNNEDLPFIRMCFADIDDEKMVRGVEIISTYFGG